MRSSGVSGQIFCYLMVLDFESTCWEDRRNIPQEISKSLNFVVVERFEWKFVIVVLQLPNES